ncbi:methyl-accepting chemotaxis protein [Devosia lacusdianchii]|uniref:methyl-accepting chemotaxis protein n=1 Tax=Devosia lacusdianchii TaxID=2917991 RepID=UPI001F06006D|nr:methyl-accepting chemotaxis protein [Devosia sp. JXJ CY 41]
MAKLPSLTIKATFILISAGMVAAIAMVAVAVVLNSQSEEELARSLQTKYDSYLLADEFRQGSDDLTRLARTFVVTGDAQYKQMYDDVIAIRDGVKARPDGTTISLVELMRRLEFSDAEFAALDRAKAESDGLVQLETTAMNVPSDAAPADHERAVQMLHSPEYAKFKADIMLPVGEFFALLDQRIEDRVGAAEQNVFLSRIAMIVAGALLLGMAVATGLIMTRKVTRRIGGLNGSMQSLVAGDLAVGVPYLDDTDEVGAMAVAVGTFRENAIKIAALSEDERRRSQQLMDRAAVMELLQSSVDDTVGAAAAGDFSKRVDIEVDDPALANMVRNVNGLIDTVGRGLHETGSVLAALAKQDLTPRVAGEYRGAFLQLKNDTNAVAENLTSVMGGLRSTSSALKVATSEILAGANDLSERTTRQAATIEETSAAMEQLASTVSQNAKRAKDASSNAEQVTRTAEQSGAVMRDANTAMERITDSSAKISNIIGLIDDIAFQTNLLALNASVEAARAGDAGKGFAVVAVEVRRLAQSAASASAEIKQLIEQSVGEVLSGSRLVSDAAGKLDVVLESIRDNTLLMHGIAEDSLQQASAIGEVVVAVRQMDEMTQHNAALVEETNAAIEQTESQAEELDRVVGKFILDASGEPVRAAEPAPRRAPTSQAKAAKTYLSQGNAAIKEDWAEF